MIESGLGLPLSWWTNTVELYPDRSVEWQQSMEAKEFDVRIDSTCASLVINLRLINLLQSEYAVSAGTRACTGLVSSQLAATLHFCLGTIQPYLSTSLTVRVGKYTQRTKKTCLCQDWLPSVTLFYIFVNS